MNLKSSTLVKMSSSRWTKPNFVQDSGVYVDYYLCNGGQKYKIKPLHAPFLISLQFLKLRETKRRN